MAQAHSSCSHQQRGVRVRESGSSSVKTIRSYQRAAIATRCDAACRKALLTPFQQMCQLQHFATSLTCVDYYFLLALAS
ncbi:hypothetical protein KCP74_03350 [Salmonella enterica subsp. enterica]|nr:hypothetical protein KCP74_03350 [Salmonella enterica subsp. enterica]